jgi:large subunit ribosomal protein L25
MSEIETIEVTKRESVGKGPARAARRAGAIPCVVYGLGETPLSIAIDELVLRRLVGMPSFFSQLFSLNVDGTKMNVLARDVQVHPVSDRPMHVDFLRVDADAAISVEVPALFINEDTCPGLLDGGILNVVRYTIEVSCRPDAIPEQIEVDLSTAQLGDSIHISSVSLPEGVVPTITDRDFTIATIAAPSVSKATDDDEDGGDAEGDAATAEGGEGESS